MNDQNERARKQQILDAMRAYANQPLETQEKWNEPVPLFTWSSSSGKSLSEPMDAA